MKPPGLLSLPPSPFPLTLLKPEPDAGRDLQVVAQLRGEARGRGGGEAGGVIARGVADHRVAHVEAREDGFRRVELKHAAQVHREVSLARLPEVGEEEGLAPEGERFVAVNLRDA